MLFSRIKFAFAVPAKRVRLGRPGTSLKMGLLGMANIGKSSTFNMLSDLNVPAENIPFCTIDPNTAYITIKDPRFEGLCKLYNPKKVTGPILRIVDIAGLVKGASEGFGLGNEFLSHVRYVDGLFHVVRAFPGEYVAHTEGSMDAVRDIQIIRHEIIQKDIETMDKKVVDFGRKASKSLDKSMKYEYYILKKTHKILKYDRTYIRNVNWSVVYIEVINKCMLLTAKPMVYLLNLSREDYLANRIIEKDKIEDSITMGGRFQTKMISYSVEHEKLIKTDPTARSYVQNIIKAAYEYLYIYHFYTVGVDEVKAWAIRVGYTAIEAAGKIHTDFLKSFISAYVISAYSLLHHPQWKYKLAKNSRKEPKTYIVKDGYIMHFNCKSK